MEKFKHQEYRDQLAEDLRGINDHETRREALESEKEGWRYKLAEERHIADIVEFREEKRLEEKRKEILEELADKSIEELIQAHPELSEKIEALRLRGDWQDISLVRDKLVPELAFPVWSKSKDKRRTQGRINVTIPESRLPEGEVNLEFGSTCACCQAGSHLLESPFLTQRPEYPKDQRKEGESDFAWKTRFDAIKRKYEEDLKKWKQSEEGQRNKEWHEQKDREYADIMKEVITQNGIKYIAIRTAETWEKRYGSIEGVEFMEIGGYPREANKIRQKQNELLAASGKKGEYGFDIN